VTDAGAKCPPQISINDAYWHYAARPPRIMSRKADMVSFVGYMERSARKRRARRKALQSVNIFRSDETDALSFFSRGQIGIRVCHGYG